jgi:hypothetical protein
MFSKFKRINEFKVKSTIMFEFVALLLLRASTLVWSDRPSHAFTRNLGSTQQTTCTMSCLVSRLVDLYNSLICAHKKGIS